MTLITQNKNLPSSSWPTRLLPASLSDQSDLCAPATGTFSLTFELAKPFFYLRTFALAIPFARNTLPRFSGSSFLLILQTSTVTSSEKPPSSCYLSNPYQSHCQPCPTYFLHGTYRCMQMSCSFVHLHRHCLSHSTSM